MLNRNLQASPRFEPAPAYEPLRRSQIFTMIALVLFGLSLFALVVRAGMHERAKSEPCAAISNAADRAICEQAVNPPPQQPAKGALAPDLSGAAERR